MSDLKPPSQNNPGPLQGSCPRARARRWSAGRRRFYRQGGQAGFAHAVRLTTGMHPFSPQAGPGRKGAAMTPAHPRSLAGATILQLVPALRDDPAGHAAVDIALTLLQAGARAMVAGDGGPLVGELRAFGGEWLPMINDTLNPLRIRANARTLAQPDRRRTHRHRACAKRGRRLERARRHPQAAGVSGDVVSRPAAGAVLFRQHAARLAGARRPRDRAVDLRVARHDRALPAAGRPHHRHPARDRHRRVQPGGGAAPSASLRCAASGRCCRRCASCWCRDASRHGTGR